MRHSMLLQANVYCYIERVHCWCNEPSRPMAPLFFNSVRGSFVAREAVDPRTPEHSELLWGWFWVISTSDTISWPHDMKRWLLGCILNPQTLSKNILDMKLAI